MWDEAQDYLSEKVDRLEQAGVDVILCVSNTMHRVVEPIMATRRTPFIHIADPAGAAMKAAGVERAALLGTLPTMRSEALARRFGERFGVAVMVPSEPDQAVVDRIIFDELVRGEIRPRSKADYVRIAHDLRRAGAQGVILGCTEIFLLIGPEDLPGFPVFDTTALHVAAAVDFVVQGGDVSSPGRSSTGPGPSRVK